MGRIQAAGLLALLGACMLFVPVPAQANGVYVFGFQCVDPTSTVCQGVAPQLQMQVSDGPSSNQVSFGFINNGPLSSIITQVYWDDAATPLLDFSAPVLTPPAGKDWAVGGTPANLPGGNTLVPPFMSDFMVSANSPTPSNGIGPTESMEVVMARASGKTYIEVINALNAGSVLVGLHVQGVAPTGGSVALFNGPGVPQVPEPGTALLLGSAMAALAFIKRKKFF